MMTPKSLEAGPLEMQVLGILNGNEPQPVYKIQSSLKKTGNDLAYTTVMTVLVRLYNKGFLKRKKEGRQYLYYQTSEKESTSQRIFERVRKSLFQNERLKPILALLEADSNLSSRELKELRKAVDEKLKKTQEKA